MGALTAAFVALVALWAVLAPVFDAPDEVLHLNSGIRLTTGWDWPEPGQAQLNAGALAAMGEASLPADQRSTFAELMESKPGYDGVDQMSQHPPLYYAYIAGVLNAIGFMDVRADQALLAVRLSGLVFAAPLPALMWASVRRFTRSPKTGVVAAAALFAVPQLAHILGAVSNDGMTVLFSSIVLWLCIRVMTGDRSWWTPIGTGVALALALLSKGTAVPLIPFVAVVLAVWPRELGLWQRIGRMAAAGGVAFLGGVWWLRNLLLYGNLQPDGLGRETQPWPEGSGPDPLFFLDRAWHGLTGSFWGRFGWLTHPLPVAIVEILAVVTLVVIVAYAFRRSPDRGKVIAIAALPATVIGVFLWQRWLGYSRTQLTGGLQGRYFFPLLVSFLTMSAVGWRNLVTPAERRTAGSILLISFAFVAALGVGVEYFAVYDGLGWFRYSPVGTVGSVAVLGLAAAAAAWAFVLSWRFIRGPVPARAARTQEAPAVLG